MKQRNTKIYSEYKKARKIVIFNGDCLELIKGIPDKSISLIITSPPYFLGKEYDSSKDIQDFIISHAKLLPEMSRILKDGGSICWQVGYHVKNNIITPLDYLVHDILKEDLSLKLRNRIIWTYGHGLHETKRFSGRHEVILWYTKGDNYYFNLDNVRVPHKYPGKTFYKGEKKGELSGNPLGKNPSDLWDIPNVKANHIEKTEHPCQFPIALAQRLVKALCPEKGTVLDPFLGSGSTAAAAILENRKFVGAEIYNKYYDIAYKRSVDAIKNKLKIRPIDKPIFEPDLKMAVAKKPDSFLY